MSEPIRIGVLGLHHDHVWSNLDELIALDDATLVAAADPHEELRNQVRSAHGCEVHDDYRTLLDRDDIDAVYLFASNRAGAELAVEAAQRGKHILIEKPMAADLNGAEAMLAAARANRVRLMINWPFAWWSQLQHAIRLAQSGDLGQIWQVKYRAAHQGPAEMGCTKFFSDWLYDEHLNGGGALMDYCCYGAVLARVLLGQPEAVFGMDGRFRRNPLPVEDNALLALRYPAAMATSEASWTQIGKLGSYLTIIYGESGTLLVEPREGAKLIKATNENEDGVEIPVPPAPPELRSGSAHFLHLIRTGADSHPLCDPAHCRDTQAILEAGRRSAQSRAEVPL